MKVISLCSEAAGSARKGSWLWKKPSTTGLATEQCRPTSTSTNNIQPRKTKVDTVCWAAQQIHAIWERCGIDAHGWWERLNISRSLVRALAPSVARSLSLLLFRAHALCCFSLPPHFLFPSLPFFLPLLSLALSLARSLSLSHRQLWGEDRLTALRCDSLRHGNRRNAPWLDLGI